MLQSNLLLGIEVVVPIFIIIVLGYLLKTTKIINSHGADALNNVVFTLLLPLSLFSAIKNCNVQEVFDIRIGLITFFGIIGIFLVSSFIIPKFIKDSEQIGVFIQGLTRGNFVILGFPILSFLYSESALDLCGFMLLIAMPIFNITSTVTLEKYRKKSSPKEILMKVIKNPLVIASLLGFLMIPLPFPKTLSSTIQTLAKAASPMALLTLGANLSFIGLNKNKKKIFVVALFKLLIIPFCLLAVGYLVGLSEVQLMTLMVFFAAPTAVVSFTMTKKIGGDIALSQQIILTTTALSIFSYVLWIFLIKSVFI